MQVWIIFEQALITIVIIIFLALFALAQNIDNFVLAGAYRFRNVLITKGPNFLIAALSGIATAAAAGVGWAFGEKIAGRGRWEMTDAVARGLLIMLGVWSLVAYFRKKFLRQLNDGEANMPVAGATTQSAPVFITNSEAIIAATALAIDNLAPSFAFGVRHPGYSLFSLTLLALFTALLSVVLVAYGQKLGRRGRLTYGGPALHFISPELVSGLLIIGIALFDPGDFAHDLVAR